MEIDLTNYLSKYSKCGWKVDSSCNKIQNVVQWLVLLGFLHKCGDSKVPCKGSKMVDRHPLMEKLHPRQAKGMIWSVLQLILEIWMR
jgi:hypothetical protein